MKIDKWRYKLWCLKIHKAINCKDQSSAIKYSILGPLKIVDILVQICHIFIQFDMKPLNWSYSWLGNFLGYVRFEIRVAQHYPRIFFYLTRSTGYKVQTRRCKTG